MNLVDCCRNEQKPQEDLDTVLAENYRRKEEAYV